MNKKTIIIIIVSMLLLIGIITAVIMVLNSPSEEQQPVQVTGEQNQNANVDDGYFMDQDYSPSAEPDGDASDGNMSGVGNQSEISTSTNAAGTSSQTETTTSSVGQELQPIAIDMVSNAFIGTNFSNYAGSVSDIPSALHTENNWAYVVANGGDITALLGGAERVNVQVMDTKVMSSTPQDTLYQITYRFAAHHSEAMAEGDTLMDRTGTATALVRVNSQGKITQYEESVEW